ncbi:FxsB family cyclophane-forming radical SAM/SPASM peptide maturase [Nonomuraea sp. NPDC005983]|uniref:FxsB family cyclophane-forming radical SAM/SPASM peptide maturase n=1 Tax=Nonomuraea sp. NPDC005983 TaxID=3155595 RepID=UPI0033B583E1
MRELPLVSISSKASLGTKVVEWPTKDVVDAALADPQWQSRPFVEFVLKVHSRCNLSCDYCYVYEMADDSWKGNPATMSKATVDQAATRFGEHMRAHSDDIPVAKVVLHGGEPLMAGPKLITYLTERFHAETPPGIELDIRMTTNAVLLTPDNLRLMRECGIHAYVSLDGGREAHNRHRKYANGRGSYDATISGLNALSAPEYRDLFSGLLCTIDVTNDPIDVYDMLVSHEPPMLDFLLPNGNWNEPPPAWDGDSNTTPYADWLIPIFDRWYNAPVRQTSIRLFDEIINLVLGGQSRAETVGLAPFQSLTIDTNGSIDFCHQLKSAFNGAAITGHNVSRDSLDALLLQPGVVARQMGVHALCDTCKACPIRNICGGGLYAHRYKVGTGYLNPSVYCADLSRLIGHIVERVAKDVLEHDC